MPARDPFSWPKGRVSYPTLNATLRRTDKQPYIGVTQGGSSRKNRGAKSAASKGVVRATQASD